MPLNPVELVAQELARRRGGPTPQGLARQQQYRLREQAAALSVQNQRRLQQALEEGTRYRQGQEERQLFLDELRGMAELRRAQEGNFQPIYGAEGGVTGRWDVRRGTAQPLPQEVAGRVGRPMPGLSEKELTSMRTKVDALTNAIRAAQLLRGQTVGGVRGDPTATGWEGYVPDVATLAPIVRSWMGGQPGVATRQALAGVQIPIGHEFFGGAFTPSEAARLRMYEPSVKDPVPTARTKLRSYIKETAKILEENLAQAKAAGKRVPVPLENLIRGHIERATSVGGQGLSPERKAELDRIYGE